MLIVLSNPTMAACVCCRPTCTRASSNQHCTSRFSTSLCSCTDIDSRRWHLCLKTPLVLWVLGWCYCAQRSDFNAV